jgi:1,4-alpha-glucan branching enzyme
VLSFIRRAKNPDDFLVIICNFTPLIRENYRVGVPFGGSYQELINSDLEIYWGSNIGNGEIISIPEQTHGMDNTLSLTLPPLSTLILKPM